MPDSAPSDYRIADVAALRARFGETSPLAERKVVTQLDIFCRAFIERAPFLCLGTQSPEGKADVSPRGDPPGFVQVLDDRTLAIPDRPGNNRLDSLTNILANPSVGLIFMIPGFEDTLRINGKAHLSEDPSILEPMAVAGRTPSLAIVVEVEEAFLHCAKAFKRSKLWQPESLQERKTLPSLTRMILAQAGEKDLSEEDLRRLDARLETSYRDRLY
ncbi:MAG: pyridoxamine 5'-phosphate oxidase family protein [Rhodospirillales bacterium]